MSLLLVLALFQARGDLTHFGNKWGWTGTGEAFVPQLVMYAEPQHFYENPSKIDRDIRTFVSEHGFNGFHVFLSCRWFDLGEDDCRRIPGSDPPVDPRTFDALQLLIRKTNAAGGMVHLWAWGDEERGQTPSARGDWGGLRGSVARRVEETIARRLGPLPGWSMGYGFDLNEWVSRAEIHSWRDRLHKLLPRPHLLGGRPAGPNRGTNHSPYRAWNDGLDYASYEHHEPGYDVYVAALEANPDKPVLSEDRFRVLPDRESKHYGVDDVRRGLWRSTLAGGVGNIWGYLLEGGTHELGSAPFPNRDVIRAHFEFIRGRFVKEMRRCSPGDADPESTTLCLGSAQSGRYLFYKERASRVELSLENLRAPQPAIAVDTRQSYREIDLGEMEPDTSTWEAPYESDWALAVGEFQRLPSPSSEALAQVAHRMRVVSGTSFRVDLKWGESSQTEDRDDRSFEVERAPDHGGIPGAFRRIALTSIDDASFSDTGVVPGTSIWYRVRAVGEASSAYSENLRVFVGDKDLVLSDLRPASLGAEYIGPGDRYYVDRDYELVVVPEVLEGALWIRTRNDDKLVDASRFLTFQVTRPVTVYVGFDARATSIPRWIQTWTSIDETIQVAGDVMGKFDLFRRDFPAGPVELGGTSAPGAAWNGGRSHYVVAIVVR
ncbi:MAG TPA: hypothetical protein VEK15_31515 [Vicinamibacteria bacterium]|nr:hypothetical protein [Vicinamibacteria bacterium]